MYSQGVRLNSLAHRQDPDKKHLNPCGVPKEPFIVFGYFSLNNLSKRLGITIVILMARAESVSLGDKSVNLPYSAYPSVTFSTCVVAPFNLHSLTPFPCSQKRLLRVYIDKETKG